MDLSAIKFSDLGISCPGGGRHYVCRGNTTQFIGCCNSDPCKGGKGECPKADLRTTSFSSDLYYDIPGQSCADSRAEKAWYTCAKNKTPFMGCCAKMPCNGAVGCAQADLLPARLSDNATAAAVFFEPEPSAAPAPSSTALHPGAIAGIVIGALLVIGAVIGLFVWKKGWRLRHKERDSHVIAEFGHDNIANALPDMVSYQKAGTVGPDDTEYRGAGPQPPQYDEQHEDPRPQQHHHQQHLSINSASYAHPYYNAKSLGSPASPTAVSYVSSASPAPTTAQPTPVDPHAPRNHHFSMQSFGTTDSQGQYAPVSSHVDSPEPSPRFGPIAEIDGHEVDGAGPVAGPSLAASHGHSRPERPLSELGDTGVPSGEPSPSQYGRQQQHGQHERQPSPKWMPYRPS